MGLDLSKAGSVVVRLPDVQAYARGRPANLLVASFVFAIEGTHALAPNEEVAEALPWLSEQDGNPDWPAHVRATIVELQRRLGHGV